MPSLLIAGCCGLCILPCCGYLVLFARMRASLSYSLSVLLEASEAEGQVIDCFGYNAHSLLQP